MARITWQNVDAPNFSGVAESQALGAAGFQSALEGIGGFLKDIDGQQRSKASTKAMEEMLKIQEVGGWDKAMKSGVFQSLGINSDMATTGLLDMIGARRDNLESDRTTDFDHTQSVYAQNRSEITDGRSDQEYQRGEESRARGIEALRIANEQAGKSVSMDEAHRQIRAMDLEPQLEAEAFANLTKLGDHWSVGPDARLANPNTQSHVNTLGRALSAERSEMEHQYQSDRALQLYVDASQKNTGYATPLHGMFERLNASVSQEDAETFWQSKGDITKLYNQLTKEYGDVPAGVIASVMENSIQEAGWVPFFEDSIKIGSKEVRRQLDELGDVKNRTGLQQKAQAYQDRMGSLERDGGTISRLQSEILVLQEKGGSVDRIAEKEKEIEKIFNSYGGVKGDPATSLASAVLAATMPGTAALIGTGPGSAAPANAAPNAAAPAVAAPSPAAVTQAQPAPRPASPEEAVDAAATRIAQAGRSQAAPAPVQAAAAIDPRIDRSNAALSKAGNVMLDMPNALAYGVDRTAGLVLGNANQALNGLIGVGGLGVGTLFPETGSAMLNWADESNRSSQRVKEQGVYSELPEMNLPSWSADGNKGAPALSAEEGDTLAQQAQAAPLDTLTLMGEAAGLSPADMARMQEAVFLIDDAGVPDDVREAAQKELEVFLKKVESSQESSAPQVQALLSRTKSWMPQRNLGSKHVLDRRAEIR